MHASVTKARRTSWTTAHFAQCTRRQLGQSRRRWQHVHAKSVRSHAQQAFTVAAAETVAATLPARVAFLAWSATTAWTPSVSCTFLPKRPRPTCTRRRFDADEPPAAFLPKKSSISEAQLLRCERCSHVFSVSGNLCRAEPGTRRDSTAQPRDACRMVSRWQRNALPTPLFGACWTPRTYAFTPHHTTHTPKNHDCKLLV